MSDAGGRGSGEWVNLVRLNQGVLKVSFKVKVISIKLKANKV